jgi:Raf kinase inhibitor-like YbhB/YbcL family protein
MDRRTNTNTTNPTHPVSGDVSLLTDGGTETPAPPGDRPAPRTTPTKTLSVVSTAFTEGQPIPARHSCEGANASPPLDIEGVPGDAASLALVVDDPDAPRAEPYVHWLLWNLSVANSSLPEAVPTGTEVLGGASQGTNDAGSVGYSGPCPPPGHGTHTYRFTLYALDSTLDLPAGSKRSVLDDAMQGHVLAETGLTGTYERD